jgi:hypothetical protein
MKASKEKIEHAKKLRDAALRILAVDAQWTPVKNAEMRLRERTLEGLKLSAWDEFSAKGLLTGGGDFKKGLEIRDGNVKVFCIYWDPIKRRSEREYLMAFKLGPWIEVVSRLGGIK